MHLTDHEDSLFLSCVESGSPVGVMVSPLSNSKMVMRHCFRFFGHIAHSAHNEDQYAVAAVIHKPRPRMTQSHMAQGVKSDLGPLNIGPYYV